MSQIANTVSPARLLFAGVPRVQFYRGGPRCPEDVGFPSSLRAALEYLGEFLGCRHLSQQSAGWALNCGYAYLIGVSGWGFAHVFTPGGDPGDSDIRRISADPEEPFRRAFAAVGHAYEWLPNDGHTETEALFRQKIIASLRDKGRPVLALGVVGPPECGLVTGYDEGGDVLMGWSFFQDEAEFAPNVGLEPTGEYRQRGWFAQTEGLICIGDAVEGPARGESYRAALRWALELARTPQVGQRATGLAAYDTWAHYVLDDAPLAEADLGALWQRFNPHNFAVGNVAEARWYGSLFVSQIAQDEPQMAESLLRAAACLAAEHDLMWKIWGLVGGIGADEAKVRQFAEPGIRQQIAEVIYTARARYAEMVEHIEAALARA